GFEMGDPDSWEAPTEAPLDDDPESLRATLWLVTDAKYKQGLAAYAKKRGKRATTVVEDETLPSFSREKPVIHADPVTPFKFDESELEVRVRRASALFKNYPEVFDSSVKVAADRVTRWFVNSVGAQVTTESTIYST